MTPRSGVHPVRQLAAAMHAAVGWRLWTTLLVMIGVALASGLSIALLVPLVQSTGLDAPDTAASPLRRLMDTMLGRTPSLELALIVFLLVGAGHGALSWIQTRMIAHVTHDVMADRRRRLFAAICRARWAFYVRQRQSDLLDALIRQVDRVGYATHALLTLVISAAMAGVYVLLAFSVSIPLTLLTLAAGALLTWSVASRRRRASRIGEALTAADAALHATLSDALASMKLVRSYGAEPRHGAALDRAIGALRATHVGQASGPITIRLWFDLGASVALAAAAWVGIRQLAMHPAELVVLLVLFLRLTPQLSYLQVYYHGLLTDLPAFLAVSRLEQACAAEADQDAGAAEAGPALAWERAVTLDAVTVRYGDVRALDAVSIEVPAGATIAIAGASGAGKTTLADVVLGLLPPETGCLRVDGRPLSRDTLRAWRDQVAYVPQDPFLFNTTIRENLLWAEPGASTADLEAALRQAAAGFVFELPAGLDSPVGDRGSLLAGGERQRIALARALLRAPRLLVLDEATSALDSENERSIRDALDRLHGRMAILVIAHRLATVQTADRIYVLDRGRLVEEGTWSQLVARDGGRFRALWRAQRLDAASVAAAGEAAALL